jgi:hypothetical protein
MDEKVVRDGMNVFKCVCGESVFVPVSLRLLAILRHGDKVEFTGRCKNGHRPKFLLTTRSRLMSGVTDQG